VTPARRDSSASRAAVLGVLAMPFGLFAPFALWSGIRSWRRIRSSDGGLTGARSAAVGIAGGLLGLAVLGFGWTYWFLAS
jgi:hypothetical protein